MPIVWNSKHLMENNGLLWLSLCFCFNRLVTNKLLLSVIIIMELGILGAVVYLKFFRK